MKTKVFVIRHGAAEHTSKGIFAGVTDSKLVALGEKQAHALQKRMANENVDFVFSSPLQRAVRTAEIVFPGHKINIIEDLHERDYGIMEFQSLQKLTKAQLDLFNNKGELKVKGAETVSSIRKRGYSVLKKLHRKYDGKCIAIVAHNDILRGMTTAAVGCPFAHIRFYNASVTMLDDFGGRWNLEILNDVP